MRQGHRVRESHQYAHLEFAILSVSNNTVQIVPHWKEYLIFIHKYLTHTHTHIYIYIHIHCVVLSCRIPSFSLSLQQKTMDKKGMQAAVFAINYTLCLTYSRIFATLGHVSDFGLCKIYHLQIHTAQWNNWRDDLPKVSLNPTPSHFLHIDATRCSPKTKVCPNVHL